MSERKYSLDVLKFLATVIILFLHFQQLNYVKFDGILNFYKGTFNWGYLVEFFFLVSGYLTYRYVQTIDETSSFWDFWWKRYLRFLPMMMICGICALAVSRIRSGKLLFDAATVITSLLGIQRWFDVKNMVNNPTWYISVLLLCYVVFFLVTWLAKRWKVNPITMYMIIIILGVCMVTQCDVKGYAFPFFSKHIGRGYYSFFAGLILRHILEITHIKNKAFGFWGSILIIAAFVIGFQHYSGYVQPVYQYMLTFVVFPAVITIAEHKIIAPTFQGKWLKDLGGISFNAFMWHVCVINAARILAKNYEFSLKSQGMMIAVTVVSFAVGAISYRFVEIPLGKLVSRGMRALRMDS